MDDFATALVLIILAIIVFIFAPMITIWSLNTIFGMSIPVNIATWFATLWLGMVVSSGALKSSSK